jgi:glycerol uptake facilitator-like aquaporin
VTPTATVPARTALPRIALAEFLGTGLLVAAVVGSGIAAQRLSPGQPGLQLLENSVVTAAALVAIILALGPVSGAQLNPIITLIDRWFGGIDNPTAWVSVGSQFIGAVTGTVVANTMFAHAAVTLSTHHRATGPVLFGEAIATFGLVLVVFGTVQVGRTLAVPMAVGAYIGAAYWFTSSTSFANPAVTVARMFTESFAGIAPSSVPPFIAVELLGGVIGALNIAALYPHVRTRADQLLMPHQESAER